MISKKQYKKVHEEEFAEARFEDSFQKRERIETLEGLFQLSRDVAMERILEILGGKFDEYSQEYLEVVRDNYGRVSNVMKGYNKEYEAILGVRHCPDYEATKNSINRLINLLNGKIKLKRMGI